MSYTFFIDESGNTGTNWLDDAQPIFTYGGWLIEDSKIKCVENVIKKGLSKQQGNEYKSSKMFKSNKGTQVALNLIEMMLENECVPFFIIAEKKYMLAAKIVESFFDPAYNSNLTNRMTSSWELKVDLANIIMELDNNNILTDFMELLKNGTMRLDKIKDINERLRKLFFDGNYIEVSQSLDNISDEGLKELVSEFEVVSNNGESKTNLTLTMPIIHQYFSSLNYYGDSVIEDNITVIHDNLRGYDENFKDLEKVFFNNDENVFSIGDKIFTFSYNRLLNLRMEDSKNELILQMADILVGFISNSLKDSRNQNKLKKKQLNIWDEFLRLRDEILKNNPNNIMIWNVNFCGRTTNNFRNSIGIGKSVYNSDKYRENILNNYNLNLRN